MSEQIVKHAGASRLPRTEFPPAWGGYLVALLGTAAVLVVRLLIDPLMGDQGPLLGFAVSVALAAWYGGRGPGLLATVAGLLSGWFFVFRPNFSLRIDRREDAYHLGLFVAVGLLTTWIGDRERAARRQVEADREEKARLLAQVKASAERRRTLIREMLSATTEGRLVLCDHEAELPADPPASESGRNATVTLDTPRSIRALRACLAPACAAAGLPPEREQDLQTATGEAAMNALRHGGGGEGHVVVDAERGLVRVWITDRGHGISEEALHRAVLEKGFSTAGTLGHGYFLLLRCVDRCFLLTGPNGTTVVLEVERTRPEPMWLQHLNLPSESPTP